MTRSAGPPTPAFVLTRWRGDGELCARALLSLRRFYPQAEIVLIVDGPLEPGDRLGFDLASTVLHRDSLSDPRHGGAWVERWMRAALEHTHSELIVRLDTDVLMTRPLRSVPDFDLFGSLEYLPRTVTMTLSRSRVQKGLKSLRSSRAGRWLEARLLEGPDAPNTLHRLLGLEAYVQGAVTGCKRTALETILASGFLGHDALKNLSYRRPRSGQIAALDDRQLGQVARALHLRQGRWRDVRSRWRPEFGLGELTDTCALWHPVALP